MLDGRSAAARGLLGSPLRRLIAGALLITAVFALIQAADYRQNVPSNDTYQYARQTLRFMGYSQTEAVHRATEMYCRDAGSTAVRDASLDDGTGGTTTAQAILGTGASVYETCLRIYHNGLTPTNARYVAIFTSRPGYPLVSAGLAAVFGLRLGMWLAALLCTAAGGALVLALLRSAGGGVATALAGQGLYLVAPTGYWGSRMLTDGPALAAALLTLLGAWWLVQGRQPVRTGAVALLIGLVAGFFVRYSTEAMVAAALTLAALACLRFVPAARHRRTVWLAALAGGGAVLSQVVSTALGWPGIVDSIQDTFTHHFIRPDVPNPLHDLLSLNVHFWSYFPVLEPTSLLLVAGVAAVAVALWLREPAFSALVLAVAATGVGTVIAHPISSQADRLMVAVWLLPVVGVPLLVQRWRQDARKEAAESVREAVGSR